MHLHVTQNKMVHKVMMHSHITQKKIEYKIMIHSHITQKKCIQNYDAFTHNAKKIVYKVMMR